MTGLKAPGNAYASTPENPVTTEQMVKPAADLAGAIVGFPGTPSGAFGSSLGRASKAAAAVPPIEIENALLLHAQGKATPSQVKKMLPEGWSVDMRRGRYDYSVYGPDGREYFIQP
jgi:hypothetical protein